LRISEGIEAINGKVEVFFVELFGPEVYKGATLGLFVVLALHGIHQ
jgi:hypothetical protein